MILDKKPLAIWLLGRWIIVIIVLVIANVWLFNKTFSKNNTNDLPRLKLGVTSAATFIIENPALFQRGGVKTFNEIKNILLLGQAGPGYIAPHLTDTIALIHLNGPLKKTRVISIPRDLAVKTDAGITKINGLYQIGLKDSEATALKLVQAKVEEVTGLKIDSFVIFDLNSVAQVIDSIGGLNVEVKNDILDTRFPTSAGGYEMFKLEKGLRFLDGQTALKFVRTRANPRGDFERIERQQEILKAIKGKIASLNPVWDFPKLWDIFKTVEADTRTNLTLSDLKNFWDFGKDLDLGKIETLSLNQENGLVKAAEMNFGGTRAYVLVAKEKPFDYTGIKSTITNFLEK